jgi:1-deoxy-D-xylulose-5-phosphate synthase
VIHALAERDMLGNGLKVRTMVLPDLFLDQDKPDKMYAKAGLDSAGITAQVMSALGKRVARTSGGKVA